jgi:hypothetical protein
MVGPVVGKLHRLGRLERELRDQKIVNGGDIEVFPAETGVGRILRLSEWIKARLGLTGGGEPPTEHDCLVPPIPDNVNTYYLRCTAGTIEWIRSGDCDASPSPSPSP